VAKYLARYFNVGNDETLFLSALIHDIGKVVLDQYFHEEFLQILDYVSSKEESFSKAEKEIVGITHYQLAAKLLQQWKFPEKVYMQVFYHHAPWHDKNYMTGSIIVYLANIFTKLAGYSCLPTEKKADLAEFARSKVMEYIVKSGFDLDHETMEKLVHSIQEIASSEGRNVLSFLEN
jgi:putative nucleotidyltransferase with HDIG domain